MDSKCYWKTKYLTRSIENRKNLQNRAKSNDCIETELQWVSTNISILLSQNNIIIFVSGLSNLPIKFFLSRIFPAFGLNTEIYGVNLRIQSECGEIWTRKNSVFGHFLRSGWYKNLK